MMIGTNRQPHELHQQMETISPDRWLSKSEVAELCKCSVATVERMAARGELASSKFGRLRRFRYSDVMRLTGDEA